MKSELGKGRMLYGTYVSTDISTIIDVLIQPAILISHRFASLEDILA